MALPYSACPVRSQVFFLRYANRNKTHTERINIQRGKNKVIQKHTHSACRITHSAGQREEEEAHESRRWERLRLTWMVRGAVSDHSRGGGAGGMTSADRLGAVVRTSSAFLLSFRGVLRFQLLGMFAPFVVRLGLALQRRTNEPCKMRFISKRTGIVNFKHTHTCIYVQFGMRCPGLDSTITFIHKKLKQSVMVIISGWTYRLLC